MKRFQTNEGDNLEHPPEGLFRSFQTTFLAVEKKTTCLRRQEGLDHAEAPLHKLPCHLLRVETHIPCMTKNDDNDDD